MTGISEHVNEPAHFQLTKISATNLAQMASEDGFCPRCFWLKSRLKFKSPWSLFPRIFRDLDEWQKTFTESYFKSQGKFPPWLDEFGGKEIVTVPGFGKFGAPHECGVQVTGVPDHLLRREDQKIVVLDYKTSRPSGDKYFPIYKAQISTYAWIAPRFGIGEVTQGALVYYEPLTSDTEWEKMRYPVASRPLDEVSLPPPKEFLHSIILEQKPDPRPLPEGLLLKFRPCIVKFELMDISPLVQRAKDLVEGEMPAAYSKNGYTCTECATVLEFSELLSF